MQVPYIDLPAEFGRPEVLAAVQEQLAAAKLVGGPAVAEFEARFADLCGVKQAVGVNSGTDALFLVFKALGIGPGAEVITAPNSFVASAGAIVAAGATPVFADVGPDYQLDPEAVRRAVTPQTRAIVPVHLTGVTGDMDRINALATEHGLDVIEDAAQAVGASFAGRSAGALGVAGCFSLHPLKNLNVAGDGGMITTDDDVLAERLRRLRNHGLETRDDALEWGYNSRLDSIQAAVGLVILDRLEEITARRRANAARYDAALSQVGGVEIPVRHPQAESVFHTYIIQADRRAALQASLKEAGVRTKVHYPRPIHLMTVGRSLGLGPGSFPVCEAQAERILSLPVHQHLSPEQVDHVVERIAAFYRG